MKTCAGTTGTVAGAALSSRCGWRGTRCRGWLVYIALLSELESQVLQQGWCANGRRTMRSCPPCLRARAASADLVGTAGFAGATDRRVSTVMGRAARAEGLCPCSMLLIVVLRDVRGRNLPVLLFCVGVWTPVIHSTGPLARNTYFVSSFNT